MKQRILIINGLCYASGHLTELLIANNKQFDVTIYDSLSPKNPRFLKPIKFINSNKYRINEIELNGYDVIIYFPEFYPVNTKYLIDIQTALNTFENKIVCVFDRFSNTLITEEYAEYIKEVTTGITSRPDADNNHLIFKLGSLYGQSDNYAPIDYYTLVNMLIGAIYNNIDSGGISDEYIPLLHVKDVGEAIIFGLLRKVTGEYCLNQEHLFFSEIERAIRKELPNSTSNFIYDKIGTKDGKLLCHEYCDLGWKPLYSLSSGIKEICSILTEYRTLETL